MFDMHGFFGRRGTPGTLELTQPMMATLGVLQLVHTETVRASGEHTSKEAGGAHEECVNKTQLMRMRECVLAGACSDFTRAFFCDS
jgi:hypothetical protein